MPVLSCAVLVFTLCALLIAVAAAPAGILAGQYYVAHDFRDRSCAHLTMERDGTELPVDQFTYSNTECTGGNVRLKDFCDEYPGDKY